jgi:hypothetical protein
MTAELVSTTVFAWIVTFLTGGLAGFWFVYDSFNLIRARRADSGDPLVRDRRFGYMIGIVIGLGGVLGCLRFHDVM